MYIELINTYNDSLVSCPLKILISISSFDFAYYQVSYLVQNSVQTTLSYVIWKHKSCFLLVTYSLVDRPQGSCALKYEKALQNYSFDLLLSLTCLPKKQPDSLSPKGLLRYINTHMYNPQSTTLSDQGRRGWHSKSHLQELATAVNLF